MGYLGASPSHMSAAVVAPQSVEAACDQFAKRSVACGNRNHAIKPCDSMAREGGEETRERREYARR